MKVTCQLILITLLISACGTRKNSLRIKKLELIKGESITTIHTEEILEQPITYEHISSHSTKQLSSTETNTTLLWNDNHNKQSFKEEINSNIEVFLDETSDIEEELSEQEWITYDIPTINKTTTDSTKSSLKKRKMSPKNARIVSNIGIFILGLFALIAVGYTIFTVVLIAFLFSIIFYYIF